MFYDFVAAENTFQTLILGTAVKGLINNVAFLTPPPLRNIWMTFARKIASEKLF